MTTSPKTRKVTKKRALKKARPPASKAKKAAAPGKPKEFQPALRKETRRDQLIVLLCRKGGASTQEISEAFDWKPHSARAALTGLRKAGLTLTKSSDAGGTRYSIEDTPVFKDRARTAS